MSSIYVIPSTCMCCGAEVPEGIAVCRACEIKYDVVKSGVEIGDNGIAIGWFDTISEFVNKEDDGDGGAVPLPPFAGGEGKVE